MRSASRGRSIRAGTTCWWTKSWITSSCRAGRNSAGSPAASRRRFARAGRRARSGALNARRSHAGPRHRRAARFSGIADPNHPAARPHDLVQLAHSGRRGARGRPHRRHGSGVLRVDCPTETFRESVRQAGARIRRQPARIAGNSRPGELPASRAPTSKSCWWATTTPSGKRSKRCGRYRSKCST